LPLFVSVWNNVDAFDQNGVGAKFVPLFSKKLNPFIKLNLRCIYMSDFVVENDGEKYLEERGKFWFLQSILEFVRKQVIKLHLHYGENRAKLAGFKNAKILLFKTHKLSVFLQV